MELHEQHLEPLAQGGADHPRRRGGHGTGPPAGLSEAPGPPQRRAVPRPQRRQPRGLLRRGPHVPGAGPRRPTPRNPRKGAVIHGIQ